MHCILAPSPEPCGAAWVPLFISSLPCSGHKRATFSDVHSLPKSWRIRGAHIFPGPFIDIKHLASNSNIPYKCSSTSLEWCLMSVSPELGMWKQEDHTKVKGNLWLCSGFEISPGYMKPCIKSGAITSTSSPPSGRDYIHRFSSIRKGLYPQILHYQWPFLK